MSNSEQVPNISGPITPQETTKNVPKDPDEFKRLLKVEESDETQKRHKRNLKKQEEGDEEEVEGAPTPPMGVFEELLRSSQKPPSIYSVTEPISLPNLIKESSATQPPSVDPLQPKTQAQTEAYQNAVSQVQETDSGALYYPTSPTPKSFESTPSSPLAPSSLTPPEPSSTPSSTASSTPPSTPIKKSTSTEKQAKPVSPDQPKSKAKAKPFSPSLVDPGLKPTTPLKKPAPKSSPIASSSQPQPTKPTPPSIVSSDQAKAPEPINSKEPPFSLSSPKGLREPESKPLVEQNIKSLHEKQVQKEPKQVELPPLEKSLTNKKTKKTAKEPSPQIEPPSEGKTPIEKPKKPAASSLSSNPEPTPNSPKLPQKTPLPQPTDLVSDLPSPLDHPPLPLDAEGFQIDKGDKKENKIKKSEELDSSIPSLITPYLSQIETAPIPETPIMSKLSPEVFELFEKMVGLLTIEKESGISTTTVVIQNPGSIFNQGKLILEHYDTAPHAFHVQFQGTAQAVEVFNENLTDLIAALEQAKLSYQVNIRRAILVQPVKVLQRKQDITKELK